MSTEGRAVSVFIPKFEECGTPFEHKQSVLAAARQSDTKHNYDSGLLNLVLGPEKAELVQNYSILGKPITISTP